jgi:hypothetical protein
MAGRHPATAFLRKSSIVWWPSHSLNELPATITSVLTLTRGWECAMRLLSVMAVLALSSTWAASVEAGQTYSPTEFAYVSEVSGRVVAFMQGRPMLLDALDVVADQTRIDLLANSELRICHSQTHQVFTLKGPLTAMIEQGGLTIENGKRAVASTGSCAAPTASIHGGGFVARGVPARR